MDPNYYYTCYGACELHFVKDAPIKSFDLPKCYYSGDYTLQYAFQVEYGDLWQHKLIKFVLDLGENIRYLEHGNNVTFLIVRVPKNLGKYLDRSGYGKDVTIKFDNNKAIVDATKKMLEDPTPENIESLKHRIPFLESVKPEYVIYEDSFWISAAKHQYAKIVNAWNEGSTDVSDMYEMIMDLMNDYYILHSNTCQLASEFMNKAADEMIPLVDIVQDFVCGDEYEPLREELTSI